MNSLRCYLIKWCGDSKESWMKHGHFNRWGKSTQQKQMTVSDITTTQRTVVHAKEFRVFIQTQERLRWRHR